MLEYAHMHKYHWYQSKLLTLLDQHWWSCPTSETNRLSGFWKMHRFYYKFSYFFLAAIPQTSSACLGRDILQTSPDQNATQDARPKYAI